MSNFTTLFKTHPREVTKVDSNVSPDGHHETHLGRLWCFFLWWGSPSNSGLQKKHQKCDHVGANGTPKQLQSDPSFLQNLIRVIPKRVLETSAPKCSKGQSTTPPQILKMMLPCWREHCFCFCSCPRKVQQNALPEHTFGNPLDLKWAPNMQENL